MTGQLNPSKAHYPPAVYAQQLPKALGWVLSWFREKPDLVATPKAKVFQKKILLFLGIIVIMLNFV